MLVLSDIYGGVAKEIIFYVGIIEDDFALRSTLENYFALRDDFKIVFSGGRLADIFIYKPFSLQDLANSFEGIIENGSFLKPNAITRLLKIIDESEPKKTADPQPKISDKERVVADHIADGKTYKEIAELLSVSVHAINYHTKNIYTKLNITSRHQLSKKLNRL